MRSRLYNQFIHLIPPKSNVKSNYFKKLPDDILKYHLFELTELKTTAIAFKETSKRHHQLFHSQIELSHFIHHVVQGEQDQAELILIKYLNDKKTLNLMLTKKMDVTDIAGKKFKSITAFQYALWAMDRHMWDMILKYLPIDQAKSQLEELEEKGVTYTKPAFGSQKEEYITNEKHFDFSPFIAALRDYVDNFEARNWSQVKTAWIKNVGVAQKNVPQHVAAEYCRKDRSFYPTPTFRETTLPRRIDFYNYVSGSDSSWFSAEGLGYTFAIIRVHRAIGVSHAPHYQVIANESSAVIDLAAITALCQVRTNELKILKDRLLAKSATPTFTSITIV